MSETVTIPRTPVAEKAALEALLESEGWAIVERYWRERFSPAQFEADVSKALDEYEPDVMAVVVQQIKATHTAMRQMLDYPRDQIRALDKAPAVKKADPYAKFRRVIGR